MSRRRETRRCFCAKRRAQTKMMAARTNRARYLTKQSSGRERTEELREAWLLPEWIPHLIEFQRAIARPERHLCRLLEDLERPLFLAEHRVDARQTHEQLC